MASNSDLLKAIDDSKKHLSSLFTQPTPDDALISGILNFVRSRFLTLIVKDIDDSLTLHKNNDAETIQLAQVVKPKDETAEILLDRVWSDFYHPVVKFYHAQHQALQDGEGQARRRIVEMRKLNGRFKKITKQSSDFYYDLLKNVITQHKIDFLIPKYFYDFLGLKLDPNAINIDKNDNSSVVKLVYIAHKCMVYLGMISRYRCLLSRFLSVADHESYGKVFDLYRHAELLLPAFGDTRSHIGVAYNDEGMRFSALYEFLRASLSRFPSTLGSNNYQKIISSTDVVIDKVNRFRLDQRSSKKSRFEKASIFFFALFGYYSLPAVWKRSDGFLINGTRISVLEKDLFDIISAIAKDGDDKFFFEKMFLLLVGAVKLNNTSKSVTVELNNLLKFTFKYISYLQVLFVEQWYDNEAKSLKMLSVFRLIYSWIKVDKLALQYSNRTFEYLKLSAIISNLLFLKYPDEKFEHRPERLQYFAEDVLVREFTPLDRLLYDFNDTKLFDSEDSSAKIIGRYADHGFIEESQLRALAVGTIIRRLLDSNQVGIIFDESIMQFNLDNAKARQKVKSANRDHQPIVPIQTVKEKREEEKLASQARQEAKRCLTKSQKHKSRSRKRLPNAKKITESSSAPSVSTDEKSPNGVSVADSSSPLPREAPGVNDIAKLSIEDDSAPLQPLVINAEDLEAKLTGKDNASIVDSLVTNTFSLNNQNIWKSTTLPSNHNIWGNENMNSYSPYGNGFNQQDPNRVPFVHSANRYPPPGFANTPFQPLSAPPPPPPSFSLSLPNSIDQQGPYLQYLGSYQNSQQLHGTSQINHHIQVPGTQNPSSFSENYKNDQ